MALDPYEIDQAQSSGGEASSPWADFSSNLFGKSGGFIEASGKFVEGMAMDTRYQSMAGGLGLKSEAFGMAADWANIGLVFPELQKSIIDIQTNIQRKQSLEKWQGRISATKARYAKSGIAVDAGGYSDTPLKAMLTLLEASDEELRWIDTDRQVREFNEVTMPGIQTRLQASQAEYQKDLFSINKDLSLKMGKITKQSAYIQGGLKMVGAAASAYGGGK